MRPINCQIYTDRLIYAVYKNLFPYYVLNVIYVDKIEINIKRMICRLKKQRTFDPCVHHFRRI